MLYRVGILVKQCGLSYNFRMAAHHTVTLRTMSFIFYRDETLLIRASEQKKYPGVYDPMGGHVEKSEDVLDCAVREIKEETGIDIPNVRLSGVMHVTNFFGEDMILFVTRSDLTAKVTPPPHEEGTFEWIPIDRLDAINVFDDLKPLLRAVRALKATELFTGRIRFDDGKLADIKIVARPNEL